MNTLTVKPATSFDVTLDQIATDKSISHRCAIFSMLSDRPSIVRNFLQGEDTLCTLNIAGLLGCKIEVKDTVTTITPPLKLQEPGVILDCGNSGTAIRLLMGFLASKSGFFVLHGDKYLASRPMRRVADPLRQVGAVIDGRENGELAPIGIRGQKLKAFDYESKIASAQVKSALVLAALDGDGPSSVSEPELSRDHTERMLEGMGVEIVREGLKVTVTPPKKPLEPLDITVPSDPSSGFFFAMAASIIPGAKIRLKNMLLNPTRIEAYKVLQRMGAKVEFIETDNKYESIGDIIVEHAPLRGVEVSENIAWLIDELPALSIAFACAEGKSTVRNAKELRVKESDRIATVVNNLNLCGIVTEEFEDGYIVSGGTLQHAVVNSHGDHRIAMSFAIAGLKCGMKVEDTECILTSFPNFIELVKELGGEINGNQTS